jgi:hypothetical protein
MFVGMVGYYMKNIDHFQFVHHNVSGEMMEVGMLEFVKYGVITMKNKVCLTHQNVLECVAMFHKHKMKKMMNSSLAGVLRQMIQIDQFYPAVGWVVSFHKVGMDYQQSEFLWKCMVAPHLVDLHGNTQFF